MRLFGDHDFTSAIVSRIRECPRIASAVSQLLSNALTGKIKYRFKCTAARLQARAEFACEKCKSERSKCDGAMLNALSRIENDARSERHMVLLAGEGTWHQFPDGLSM